MNTTARCYRKNAIIRFKPRNEIEREMTANDLKQIMKRLNLDLYELCHLTGYSPSTVVHMVSGSKIITQRFQERVELLERQLCE